MENSVENSHGAGIPKKSRSLDLKSLYKSGVTKEGEIKNLKRKKSGGEDGDERRNNKNDDGGDKKKKKKKSRKEVSLSSLKDDNDSTKKSADEVYSGQLSSASHDSKDLKESGLSSQKFNSGSGFNSVSLSLSDNVFRIPKRKRGFVGRKKFDGAQLLKPVGQSNGKVAFVDQVAKLSPDDSGSQVESSKVKRKKGFDEFKENRNSESNLARPSKDEEGSDGHLVVNNGDLLLKKSQRNRRKRKKLAPDCKSVVKEAVPLADNSIRLSDDSQEDDEENLEENAARMLSSRFDPSCTGFSSNSKASSLRSANGLSFLLSSGGDFVGRGSKSLSGSESASVDTAVRVLRPRKQHKEKGNSRKRRHFYEIFLGDLDAYWVLNRRIKVYWPLDQSWYYGLVNDYDKERKFHHVKYDDRDEEWIDLQNERFKLLLLPSEVPGKAERRKSVIRNRIPYGGKGGLKISKEKEKRDLTTDDDSCLGSYLDSEPIISWLARSTRRIKSSPSYAAKKQKTSGSSLHPVSSGLSDEAVHLHGCLDKSSSRRDKDKSKLSSNSELLERLPDTVRLERSAMESTTCFKDSKQPIVYFRRRFRKTDPELSNASEDNHVSSSAPELSHAYEDNHVYSSAPVSIASFGPLADGIRGFEGHDVSLGRLDSDVPLWPAVNVGLLDFYFPSIKSGQIRFELNFPVQLVLNDSFGAENFWLFRAVFLLQHGVMMTRWPKVQLEMLFVDNVVGLRFLLFEGCLMQAVALIALVLRVFHRPSDQGKYLDSQLPVTSIRCKFSCVQNLTKQLVFAFYNFSELNNSKWVYLDCKLKRHCMLTRQLPLSECTYDNIHAFQNGRNQLPLTSACGRPASIKGLRKRPRQGISVMGFATDCTYVNISQPSSNSNEMHRKVPPFALCFAAAPTFFLSLHLKLLMEHCAARISFRDHDSVEHPENLGSFLVDDSSSGEGCSKDTVGNNLKALSNDTACDEWLSRAKSEEKDRIKSPLKYQNGDVSVAGTSAGSRDSEKVGTDAIVQLQKWQSNQSESEQCALSPRPSVDRDKSNTSSHSFLNGLGVEIPSFNQFEKPENGELHSAQHSTDLSWNMNGGIIPSPNPTARRSTWHRNKNNSSSFGHLSHGWSDGKADVFQNGFGNGPKKPRTQVSYMLPFGGFDVNKHRSQQQKALPHKRIRRANEKRPADASRGSQRNLELLSCDANVLITLGDRGWRECGAQVVLELFDHNEWKLAVKISGTTKYSYKAHQFLQPGSTNRYTHAMMWKGGKDWILEFPDRSQWALFKEMHEECYNRNIRAALIKNIPIPGVYLIEENDDSGTEVAFVRSSSKYFRQVETDVDMALDPSRALYDMDSDDEQWILNNPSSSEIDDCGLGNISEEMFERTMDMFEKAAYAQQCDQFTSEEIEDLTDGVGPMDVIKTIYEHWRQKRQSKGMPLIRHLQPPLWERYQQQVKEWELALTKNNTNIPNGCQEKAAPIEKPPMFAFCLKPRGLEVPNKGSKQRSQRKFSVAGQSNAILGDQDGFHAFGRRLNGCAFADDKVVYPAHSYESLDDSPLPQSSPRMFSPRDASSTGFFSMSNDGFDRNHIPKLQRNKSKRFGMFAMNDQPMMISYNQRTIDKRNGIHRWNMGSSEWPRQRHYNLDGSQRHGIEQLDGSDLDEFRLRDASGAAQHAVNMAKLKRERAQRLLYRADLAIHKAVVALMTAEAIKASSEDLNGDG
uniref:Enhancer of polycomb-like protein n=2 Tax=Fagus sylvatica TaxID=28930 RepID=A0A2N9ERU2_FAGSY